MNQPRFSVPPRATVTPLTSLKQLKSLLSVVLLCGVLSGCRGGNRNIIVNQPFDGEILASSLDPSSPTYGACDTVEAPDNQCTLRAAVQLANAGAGPANPAIGFNDGRDITLSADLGQIVITRPVDITGFNGDEPRISASGAARANGRVFDIAPGIAVTLRDLGVRNGKAVGEGEQGMGSGIRNAGSLTLDGVEIATCGSAASGNGGGIFNTASGTLNLIGCTVGGNLASAAETGNQSGGAGGGLFNAGNATLTNTTFYNNTAAAGGNIANAAGATLTARFCTVTKGVGTTTGGIQNSGTANVNNTIIAENLPANDGDISGAFTSGGFNLIGDTGGGSGFTAATDILNQSPGLATTLADNGGLVRTVALVSGSRAIDKGNSAGSGVTTDGRVDSPFDDTFTRPVDNPLIEPAPGGDNSDIGAFEEQSTGVDATFIVTTISDQPDTNVDNGACQTTETLPNQSQACSLRAAIQQANANPAISAIHFNITSPAGTVKTITLDSALPDITAPIFIDGRTQPGFVPNTATVGTNSVPTIDINGNGNGNGNRIFNIRASNTTLRGLVLRNAGDNAAVIIDETLGAMPIAPNNVVIAGCFIGTLADGTTASPSRDGVSIRAGEGHRVGGSVLADRNLISGNSETGVEVAGGRGHIIAGNLIGTTKSGLGRRGNGSSGISIFRTSGNADTPSVLIGGLSVAERNVISDNGGEGIRLNSDFARVLGCFIGVDANGTLPLGNSREGININGSDDHRIGGAGRLVNGTPTDGLNVISGNTGDGVYINGGDSNVVRGSFIGVDVTGTVAIGNGDSPVNPDFPDDPIELGDGVHIRTGNNNIIGLADGAADGPGRNVISGNFGDGVTVEGVAGEGISRAVDNVVASNIIGLDVSGTQNLGNGGNGIFDSVTTNTVIGGVNAGGLAAANATGNLISGNGLNGVRASNSNGLRIIGNRIGTNGAGTGTTGVGNDGDGIFISSGGGIFDFFGGQEDTVAEIGTPAAGNLISGNANGINLGLDAIADNPPPSMKTKARCRCLARPPFKTTSSGWTFRAETIWATAWTACASAAPEESDRTWASLALSARSPTSAAWAPTRATSSLATERAPRAPASRSRR
jgi:CSLREA domain-containing protein